jgi:predicted CoA-substrate-specific enzyme activase
LDIGSLVVKMVVLDRDRRTVLWRAAPSGHSSLQIARGMLDEAPVGERTVVATGYGRVTFPQADIEMSEITCHARGASHLFPDVGTVIDVGGQDSKVMRVGPEGRVLQFAMNDRCAAGTGRFLEVMAGVLGVTVQDIGPLAQRARERVSISSTCAVFAESEVIGLLAAGRVPADIAAGLTESIASRIAALVRQVGVRPRVVMTGGVANNLAVVHCIADALGCSVEVPENPQLAGALGAALFAGERCGTTGFA